MNAPRTLVIACGALAHELKAITEINQLGNVTVECLPAALHNRPNEIPDAVRARVRRARAVGQALDAADDLAAADLVDGEVRVTHAAGSGGPPFS